MVGKGNRNRNDKELVLTYSIDPTTTAVIICVNVIEDKKVSVAPRQ